MKQSITALLFITCSQSLPSMDLIQSDSDLTPCYQDSHYSLIDDPSYLLLLSELSFTPEPVSLVIDDSLPLSPPSPVFIHGDPFDESETEPETPPAASSSKKLRKMRKPNLCPVCKKDIVGALKFHLFTHASKKPYQCSKCDYTTNQPGNCRRHIVALHYGKAHVIEKAQLAQRLLGKSKSKMKEEILIKKCDQCPKKFGDNYGLKRHQAACHSPSPSHE